MVKLAEKAVEIGTKLSLELCSLRDDLVNVDGFDEKQAAAICMNAAIEQLATVVILTMGGGNLSEEDFAKSRDVFNRKLHKSVHAIMNEYGKDGKSTYIEIKIDPKEEEKDGDS
jgi:hypothetical protein